MSILFLGLFAAAALVHLISIFFKSRLLTAVSKLCLLPLLLALYLVIAKAPLWMVILGGILGWLGDALLLGIGSRLLFTLGLSSFLLGHLAYIGVFLSFIPGLNLQIFMPFAVLSLAMAVIVLVLIRPDRAMLIPTAVYALVLELMALCALQLALYHQGLPTIVIFAGSLCFLVSDITLAGFTFKSMRDAGPGSAPGIIPAYASFLVMITYIAAQFCIIGGLALVSTEYALILSP